MGEIRESAKTVMIRDMDLEQIKCVIDDTLNSITIIGHTVAVDKNRYDEMKHHFEINLLKEKYSEKYAKIRALSEKEEKARIVLHKEKEELIKFKREVDVHKAELEHKQLLLKYLFRLYDEKVKRE